MSEPFLAEIKMVGFNFAPRGWAFCDGQVLPINQNQSLYSLLGTTYGGDGRTSFALPDLRSRTPIHRGGNHHLGSRGGEESVNLISTQIPAHTHTLRASSLDENGSDDPTGQVLAAPTVTEIYGNAAVASNVTMRSGSITNAGGGQSHDNMQPYIALSFCIALQGLFPPRN